MQITLRAARVNAGLTQEAVQAALGIARSTLTRWEKYKTEPSRRNKGRLCELYGVQKEQVAWGKCAEQNKKVV